MITHIKTLNTESNSSKLCAGKTKNHRKVVEVTYRNNANSDYTEKIRELDKNFDYSCNSNYYWADSEQSLFYGTPLYEVATPTQKKVLNHLYWVIQYNNTAASENNTILYNLVTNGVFEAIGGYDTLCQELELETCQEQHHIHAFQNIGYKTNKALLGKTGFRNSFRKKLYKSTQQSSPFPHYQGLALRLIAKMMLKNSGQYYSNYLRELENKGESIPIPTNGLGARLAPQSLQMLFTLNWGSSPFLACYYYALRYVANALLKNQEHNRSRYFKGLEKKGEFIPAPTAVARYHHLDESFHTTISQELAQDFYKNFPKPTLYEKFFANMLTYMMQHNIINRLSGLPNGLPARCFPDDSFFMLFVYQLLQTPPI